MFVQDNANNIVNNKILANSIHSNGDLGIGLAGGPVTPNDAGDGDDGANHLQNFPVLSSATEGAPGAIEGSLDSGAGSFRIEFFSNATCDPSGHGEGAVYLGSLSTAANTPFSFPVNLTTGDVITATATDAAGNTSEFSACATAVAADQQSLTVNTTADTDDGACTVSDCSLREAITRANGLGGTNTISFDIPAALVNGAHTISPTSALPSITAPVTIDGTSEPDFDSCAAGPVIELDGSSAGATDGLTVAAGGSTIEGLAINRFGGNGLLITGGGSNLVRCNRIGTDPSGTVDRGNGNGIRINSSDDNLIGGAGLGDRNVISSNDHRGL